jgi:DNA polymerase-3 subunit delta'
VIPVDEARRLPEFFSKAPGSAPYRVAIIDAADDLNVNAANAVLKTLEEPPERGVLFLVSHARQLLPTIRSRCRRLAIAPLDEAAAPSARAPSPVSIIATPKALARMARRARARPATGRRRRHRRRRGRARSCAPCPAATRPPLLALADTFRGGEGMARFALLFERLADQVHDMATARRRGGPLPRASIAGPRSGRCCAACPSRPRR